MNLLERKRIARDLSGPAATVLFALLMSGGAVTAVDLEDWTRLSRNTVTNGLHILQKHGLVTHYGKFQGWSLNHTQLQLWQGHSGVLLSENATSSSADGSVASVQKATIYQIQSEFVALTDPITETPVDNSVDKSANVDYEKCSNCAFLPAKDYEKCSNSDPFSENNYEKCSNCAFLSHTHARDQIRSDSYQSDLKDFDFKSDQIRRLIEFLEIREPGKTNLLKANADPVVLYGWYLWASEQSWIISATAWAIRCTLKGSQPEAAWLRTARQKLEAGDLTSAKPGTCPECGGKIHPKIGQCFECGVIKR